MNKLKFKIEILVSVEKAARFKKTLSFMIKSEFILWSKKNGRYAFLIWSDFTVF